MAAQKFDFSRNGCNSSACEQGATFSYNLIWQKETPVSSGIFVVVDITNYTAKMQVRKNLGTPIIIDLNTTNGGIVLDGINGKISLLISATNTQTLVPGFYKYDLELISPTGFVTRFIEGTFEVVGQITV